MSTDGEERDSKEAQADDDQSHRQDRNVEPCAEERGSDPQGAGDD
ncbi:hypothetical protein [Cellulosimicrobium sp. NPDC055967]